MPQWPRSNQARSPYRVIRDFEATPLNEVAFRADSAFYAPTVRIAAGTGVRADPKDEYPWQGQTIVVFTREYDSFYASKEVFSNSTEPPRTDEE
jgi:hypothetical protein